MKAQIVYDKPCRIRFRCGSNAFTKELERSIHKLVMSNPWAIACEAHYENGGILIRYKEGHRAEAVELVRKLRGSDLAPVSDNQYDTEEIDRTFKSDLAKLVMQRYIRKAVLPAPIGAALIVYSGLKYIAKGVSALFDGKLTVEVLDGASISACLIQKNYNTAGTVMFLLSVSGLLEDYTRARTRAALTDSLAIKADQVWLAGKDADTLIPMSQLQVDDCIRVRTGSVIPVDGQITEGEAYINEASMTGEPLAVMKSAGASVFAGTVVEEGSVVIKVRKLSSDTKISKIIELIDNSENLKAGVQSKAERLADSIVPYSFLAFGLTLLFTRNVTKAVSVLMVDYSCAIKLSTPIFNIIVSYKRPYGSFRNSIFIKRIDSHIYRFAFDQRTNILLRHKGHAAVIQLVRSKTPKDVVSDSVCLWLDGDAHIHSSDPLCLVLRCRRFFAVTESEDAKTGDAWILMVRHFKNGEFQITDLYTLFFYDEIMRQIGFCV